MSGFLGTSFFLFLFTGLPMTILTIVIISVIVSKVKSSNAKRKNESKTVSAKVISKRVDVSGYHGVSTSNYISFETADGYRFELSDRNNLSGTILVNDYGYVTYYQNELLGFKRL